MKLHTKSKLWLQILFGTTIAIGDGTKNIKCLEQIDEYGYEFNVKPWPAFARQWGNKDQGFYFETIEYPGVRIFITNEKNIEHLLRGTWLDYDDYAKKNPNDPHIQENYQNLLKIYDGVNGNISFPDISSIIY